MLLQSLAQTRHGMTDLGYEPVFTRIQESVFKMDRFMDRTAVQYTLRAVHKLTYIFFQIIVQQRHYITAL